MSHVYGAWNRIAHELEKTAERKKEEQRTKRKEKKESNERFIHSFII